MSSRFSHSDAPNKMSNLPKNESEWRAHLSSEQFRILRQKGTEMAGTGEYDKFFKPGTYTCAGCNAPLYRSCLLYTSDAADE